MATQPLRRDASPPDPLVALGAGIRARRKQLRVSATAAAEAAGLSRVTLHRIECGEPTVALGLVQRAAAALGLQLQLADTGPRRRPQPQPGARQHQSACAWPICRNCDAWPGSWARRPS